MFGLKSKKQLELSNPLKAAGDTGVTKGLLEDKKLEFFHKFGYHYGNSAAPVVHCQVVQQKCVERLNLKKRLKRGNKKKISSKNATKVSPIKKEITK